MMIVIDDASDSKLLYVCCDIACGMMIWPYSLPLLLYAASANESRQCQSLAQKMYLNVTILAA